MTLGTTDSPAPPKFRDDLIVSRHDTPGGTPFVVKDPVSQEFFGLRETEFFVVQQLDGSTPLDVVQKRVEQRFGATLDGETLTRFVKNLRELGLLAKGGAGSVAKSRRRIQGNLLYLRVRMFDPNRLLSWLTGPARVFFTPAFVLLSLLLIIAALGLCATSSGEIARDVARLFRLDTLALALLALLAVGMAHELAHGVTCRRFGGQVHDIGFMLIYFTPAFYCDVSDTWLFPERAKRLLVTLSGPYFELVIWAAATWTWRLTNPGTWISDTALVVVATSGVKTLLNLNPLIKLDGYYLLSDAVGIPNLRRRAFHYIGRLFTRRRDGAETSTVRERQIYLWYGLAAAVYSFSLLGIVTVKVGGLLIERFQALGLVLFTLLIGPRIRRRLGEFGPRRSKVLQRAPAAPGSRPVAQPTGAGNGRGPWRRRAVLVTLLAAGAVVLLVVPMELRVTGEFTVLPARRADVRSEEEGIIASILIDEGAVVRPGQVVARLLERDLSAEVASVRTEIAEKQAMLRMLRAGPTREQVALAEREIETAQTRLTHTERRHAEAEQMRAERIAKLGATVRKFEDSLAFKRVNVERHRTLLASQLVARLQLEEAEEALAVTGRELEEATAELAEATADNLAEIAKERAIATTQLAEANGKRAVLVAGSRPEEIEAREAELARLGTKLRYLEERSRLLTISSPIGGVVTTPSRHLQAMAGQKVGKGDLVVTVQELGTVMTEIAVPEKEIADVKVGQRVAFKLRAYPAEVFEGRVTSVGTTVRLAGAQGSLLKDATAAGAVPDERAGERLVLVTSEIDNRSMLLKPDMTGKAKILGGEHSIVGLAMRRLARIVRVEFWSWW